MTEQRQMMKTLTNLIGEIYPAFHSKDTFKRCLESFYQGLQREPCSTLFHCLIVAFGIFPFFGFIMFITGTFLLTFLCGSIAFCFMLFSGLLVFGTLMFFILVFCVWMSLILTGICKVWMEWPSRYGEVGTIRKKAIAKLSEMGFNVGNHGQTNDNGNDDLHSQKDFDDHHQDRDSDSQWQCEQ